jgi:hypothetical protein
MDWLLILAWVVVLAGIFCAGFIYARSPTFWITFGAALIKKLAPFIWAFISKRMSPEEEAKWREEQKNSANPPGMRSRFPRRDK